MATPPYISSVCARWRAGLWARYRVHWSKIATKLPLRFSPFRLPVLKCCFFELHSKAMASLWSVCKAVKDVCEPTGFVAPIDDIYIPLLGEMCHGIIASQILCTAHSWLLYGRRLPLAQDSSWTLFMSLDDSWIFWPNPPLPKNWSII